MRMRRDSLVFLSGGTSTASSDTIDDNVLVRGDGGVRGIQGSGITVSDVASNNVTLSSTAGNSLTLATADTNRNILLSPHGTGAVQIPASVTSGLQLYNTADQTTNYERLEFLFAANVATIRTGIGGSGTIRNIAILAGFGSNTTTFTSRPGAQNPYQFTWSPALSTAQTRITFGPGGSDTTASGQVNFFAITPSYNQSSGTAANTDLLINRTQTAVGSGAQRLIDLQVGGVTQFNVSNVGVVTVAAATATPAGGAVGAVQLFGTTAAFGIYYGSGAPTVTAAQGSVYIRSDGSSIATRLYINTTGSTTWTNVVTAV